MASENAKSNAAMAVLELVAGDASPFDPDVVARLREIYRDLDADGRAFGIIKHELLPAVLDASRSGGGWPEPKEITRRYVHIVGPLTYWARRGGPDVPERYVQKMSTVVFYKQDKMDFGHSNQTIQARLDNTGAAISHALMARHNFEIDHAPEVSKPTPVDGYPNARHVAVRVKAPLSQDEWLVVLEAAMRANSTLSDHRDMKVEEIPET